MKKVLILDGDLHFANTLKMYFRKVEFEPIISTDANELDDLFHEHQFDVILCNTQVAHKSGVEIIGTIRKKFPVKNASMILITPNNNLSMNASYAELDVDAILHKPISFQNLMKTIEEVSTSKI
ncbi:MAG: response regulator [Chitinophagaceae bacterium]|nr:response regulator [Chitinophagaceae bacterium]